MVSKFIIMKLFYYILLLSYLLSFERGAIHSIEFLDYKTVEEIQSEINGEIGEEGITINAEYDVSLYKIVYETLDGYGDSTLVSGVIGVPENSDHAFVNSVIQGLEPDNSGADCLQDFNIIDDIKTKRW